MNQPTARNQQTFKIINSLDYTATVKVLKSCNCRLACGRRVEARGDEGCDDIVVGHNKVHPLSLVSSCLLTESFDGTRLTFCTKTYKHASGGRRAVDEALAQWRGGGFILTG